VLTSLTAAPLLTMDVPMAGEKPKTQSIKLATDVVELARVIAALRGVSMTDMLSDYLRPTLVQWEREEIKKRSDMMPKTERKK
jgi:hypothetical protein